LQTAVVELSVPVASGGGIVTTGEPGLGLRQGEPEAIGKHRFQVFYG
jgi:hypothetical protein